MRTIEEVITLAAGCEEHDDVFYQTLAILLLAAQVRRIADSLEKQELTATDNLNITSFKVKP